MDHDHDHSHESGSKSYWLIAAIMGVYACVEAVIGLPRSPLIVSDAGHNASDALFGIVGGVLKRLTHGSRYHLIECTVPKLVNITACLLTIVTVGFLSFYETVSVHLSQSHLEFIPTGIDLGWATLVLTIVLGTISWVLNRAAAWLLARNDGDIDKGWAAHYHTDARASLALVATSLPTLIWRTPWLIVGGALYIIYKTTQHNLHVAAEAYSGWHRKQNHA